MTMGPDPMMRMVEMSVRLGMVGAFLKRSRWCDWHRTLCQIQQKIAARWLVLKRQDDPNDAAGIENAYEINRNHAPNGAIVRLSRVRCHFFTDRSKRCGAGREHGCVQVERLGKHDHYGTVPGFRDRKDKYQTASLPTKKYCAPPKTRNPTAGRSTPSPNTPK